MILAVVNQKGGAAKTTSTIYVAQSAAKRDLAVLVADADARGDASKQVEEGTAGGWISGVQAVEVPSDRLLRRLLEGATSDNELIVIDTPPNSSQLTNLAMEYADVLLIPMMVGVSDLDAVVATLDMRFAKKPHGIVLCRTRARSLVLAGALRAWEDAGEEVWGVMPDRLAVGTKVHGPLDLGTLLRYDSVLSKALTAFKEAR